MSVKMRAAFLTLGCKVNYYETEKMMQEFAGHGFEIVDFRESADVYVINTCTVTNMADRKSRKMIHRARKMNPDSLVVAAGCYVERAETGWNEGGMADVTVTNAEKKKIVQKVTACLNGRGKLPGSGGYPGETPGCVVNDASGRTRKYIKIQDGCNQFCSYCTIPYVRGGGVLSSRGEDEILEEIRRVAARGFKEVVITGIHLSSYGAAGVDAREFVRLKGAPLAALLEKINGVDGIERIRLGSLEPRIICPEFMERLARVEKLCPHFHLSLQSGCDATLQRMNRHYTAAQYKEGVNCLRRYYEHPAVTTDIIVGFPGETEEEFGQTREFVKEAALADIHVFPYSIRSGTKAAQMEGQVSPDVKRRRSDRLIADAAELKAAYTEWFMGKTEKVLFEEIREINGRQFLAGHNERYMLFGVPLDEAVANGYAENEICDMKIGAENCLEILPV